MHHADIVLQYSFQSTLLMRGATRNEFSGIYSILISIHAPHARSDLVIKRCASYALVFQSTLLMRGATFLMRAKTILSIISIHAPHARSDTPGAGA